MNVIDWPAKHALYSPGKVALIDVASNRRFTYREFNDRANQFCEYLESAGVKPGDRVAVLLPNGPEILLILFGATKLGAIFVPLNTKLAAPELGAIVADAQPTLLIYDPEFKNLTPTLPTRLVDITSVTLPLETRNKKLETDLESPQMLLYTSGTTGKPKGVILSHRMTLWNAINTSLRLLMPTDTALIHTPMFYTGGLNVYALPAFYLGATIAILKSFSAEEVFRQVEQLRITVLFAVPTQLVMMADSPEFARANFSSLRYVVSGGAPCPIPLIERWIARGMTLRQGFGMTEVGPNCFVLDAPDALRKAGSIGFPNFAIEARIVDDNGHDVRSGEIGELIMRTPAMCSGYWNNPEQTQAAIRDGWLYSGDLASRDAEGYYYIVDRKKDMFISGGENVYPAEIEHLLRTHPQVADVAVVGQPHAKWGEVGCAAVVRQPGAALTEEELLAFCSGKIAKFKIPKYVVFVDDLPRTVSGKVQKQALRCMLV